jgi:hypothetical protein
MRPTKAFSSEVDTGSRKENASKQKTLSASRKTELQTELNDET